MNVNTTNQVDEVEIVGSNDPNRGSKAITDLFATDLFAANHSSIDETTEAFQTISRSMQTANAAVVDLNKAATPFSPWHGRLPHVSRIEANLSAALAHLPSLSIATEEALRQIIGRYTRCAPEQIALRLVDVREASTAAAAVVINNFSEEATAACVFTVLNVEPHHIPFVIRMEADFTRSLIHRMLGGHGVPLHRALHAALTQIEQSVIEFLWLNIIRTINSEINRPVIKLSGITAKAPTWLQGRQEQLGGHRPLAAEIKNNNDFELEMARATEKSWHGYLLTVLVRVNDLSGLARLYIGMDVLKALCVNGNPLLSAVPDARRKMIRQAARVLPDFRLAVIIGAVDVTRREVAELEDGDIVVVARPEARWSDGTLNGKVRISVGDGNNVMVHADATSYAEINNSEGEDRVANIYSSRTLKVKIIQVLILPPTQSASQSATSIPANPITVFDDGEMFLRREQLQVEEQTMLEVGASKDLASEFDVALNEVMLTLRVELAGRRIRLAELAELRTNQIIDLERAATDPVELIVGDRVVARGELIDIEGRLGVRILQVLR